MTENEIAETRSNPELSHDANSASDHVHHRDHDASYVHGEHAEDHYSHREQFEPRH